MQKTEWHVLGGMILFASLGDAIAALDSAAEAIVLARFAPVPADNVIIAVNEAAAANPLTPLPGDHPDERRDRNLTADIELDYLYRQLIERGHARQVLALGGHLRELTINRVEINGDERVYAFVKPRLRDPVPSG